MNKENDKDFLVEIFLAGYFCLVMLIQIFRLAI